MMMLIHRICMAFSGLGKFISVAKEISVSAAMLLQGAVGREVMEKAFRFCIGVRQNSYSLRLPRRWFEHRD